MGRRSSRERVPEFFTAEVERLDQEGRGIAHQDGKVVFIQGALPGELVRYEQVELRRGPHLGGLPRKPLPHEAALS